MFEAYPDYEDPLARVQLICVMLAMGTALSLSDFIEVARQPRSFIAGVAAQILIIPALAVLIDFFWQLDDGIAVGLILVAAMPGGALSKLFSYVGRGNAALSISLSIFSTIASLLTVPLMLQLLASRYISPDFQMPVGQIIQDVVLCLFLPLLGGMLVARMWPAQRAVFAAWCVRFGLVVVVLMIVGALGSGRIRPLSYGWSAPLAIIVFCIAGQQVSMLPFYLLKWPRNDRMAVGIEVTMRNMNLALLIKASLFPGHDPLADGVLYVILFYAGTAMGAGLPLALNHRRLSRHEATSPLALSPALQPPSR